MDAADASDWNEEYLGIWGVYTVLWYFDAFPCSGRIGMERMEARVAGEAADVALAKVGGPRPNLRVDWPHTTLGLRGTKSSSWYLIGSEARQDERGKRDPSINDA